MPKERIIQYFNKYTTSKLNSKVVSTSKAIIAHFRGIHFIPSIFNSYQRRKFRDQIQFQQQGILPTTGIFSRESFQNVNANYFHLAEKLPDRKYLQMIHYGELKKIAFPLKVQSKPELYQENKNIPNYYKNLSEIRSEVENKEKKMESSYNKLLLILNNLRNSGTVMNVLFPWSGRLYYISKFDQLMQRYLNSFEELLQELEAVGSYNSNSVRKLNVKMKEKVINFYSSLGIKCNPFVSTSEIPHLAVHFSTCINKYKKMLKF